MKIGVVFPQTEIGQDPAAIRDYAQAVESMGYTHGQAGFAVEEGEWGSGYLPMVAVGSHRSARRHHPAAVSRAADD